MSWKPVLSCLLGVLIAAAGAMGLVDAFTSTDTQHDSLPHPGTQRMAARLAQLDAETDITKQFYLNDRRAEMYEELAENADTLAKQLEARVPSGYELILAGQSAEGVAALVEVRDRLEQPDININPASLQQISTIIAVGYLRIGEQENCIAHHGVDSCLLPIKGSGIHTIPNGSRSAIGELRNLLDSHPENLKYRWLLNLAHMTLGEYPDSVPEEFRIPPSVFKSDYDLPRFFDAAGQSGLDKVGLAGGCVTEDMNGDGYIDVVSSSWGQRDQIRYFENNREGAFIDKTEAAGLTGITGGLNLCHADYDNDGHMDVFVLRGAWLGEAGKFPNSLLRNLGDGTFEDVTERAGLLSFHPTQTASWGDYDNDGWVDLYIGNESGPKPHRCELYHNNGDGTFTDVAAESGVAKVAFVKGVSWGDYDNDGRLDLYVSTLGQPNVLYHNDGPTGPGGAWRFTDMAASAGVTKPIESFPVWFWDYDNDGWLDIMAASYPSHDRLPSIVRDYLGQPFKAETARLYRNNRDGTFSDVTHESNLDHIILAMGANFGDLDNDGWLDAYFGTGEPDLGMLIPNRMFRNDHGKRFQDVTTAGGFGHLQKGHGVSFVDLDNDGDQDIYEVMGGAFSGDTFQSVLFENPGFKNRWVTLRLEGVKSNRAAIGARIKVTVDRPAGPRDIYMTVSSGGTFGSASFQQEIGLGDATSIKSIEIDWPTSGTKQVFTDVPMNRILRITETDKAPTVLNPKSFDLSPAEDGTAGACPMHMNSSTGT